MIYNFKDIQNSNLYESRVIIICGSHSVFNNEVIDRARDKVLEECLSRLSVENKEELTLRDLDILMDFNRFMEVVNVPPFVGRWVCRVNLNELSKSQENKLEKYIKAPSKYGLLVLEINDFREFREYINNKAITNSKETNLIKLSFPCRKDLKKFITSKVDGYKIADKAMDLFILRMSDNYDEYETMLGMVKEHHDNVIDFDDMKGILQGVDNYAVDDFLLRLIRAPRGKRPRKKDIYKIMITLKDDMGAYKLLNAMTYIIDRLVIIRTYINEGSIPGRLRYSLKEFKDKLPEDSIISKMSDYTLRKNIEIALNVSIKDLFYMKMIAKNVVEFDDESAERVLIALMNRCLLGADRLNTNLGIQNDIELELYELNSVLLRSRVMDYLEMD